MKKHIITALATLLTATAASAELTQARRFEINREALRILSAYERTSTLGNSDALYEFRELFGNDQLPIFNDLIGISNEDKLTVGEYANLLRSEAQKPRVTLMNVKHQRTWQDLDGKEYTRISFDKNISYSNNCGAILDAEVYYGAPYPCEMTIEIDPETNATRIASLEGKMPDGKKRLVPGFSYVDYSSPTDTLVLANGQPLTFNFGQALVERNTKFSIHMDDCRLVAKKIGEDPCTHYELHLTPLKFRLKPHYDITMGTPFDIDCSSQIDISQKSSSFGLDFGYMFMNRRKAKMGIFTGVGYTSGTIDMSLASIDYYYSAPSTADMDGDTYTRYMSLRDMRQSVSLKAFSIPLYLELVLAPSKYANFYIDLGVKAYLNAGSTASDITGQCTAYGVYPQYANLMIDANYMNGFSTTYYDISDSNLKESLFNAVSFDGIAGVGYRCKLFGPLMLDAGVSYGMSITPFIKGEKDPGIIRAGSIKEQQAMATYQVATGTSVRTFTDEYLGDVKRSGMKLHLGLIIKL